MQEKPLLITLVGFGKMGKTIKNITDNNPSVKINYVIDFENNTDGVAFTHSSFLQSDVVIDFSHPSAVVSTIKSCVAANKPIVVGTTGWSDYQTEIMEIVREKGAKLIYGSNYSLGVQMFNKLIKQAALLFGQSKLFDVALNEVHHTQKADAPSGTALTLAKTYLEYSKTKNEVKTSVPNHEKVESDVLYVTSQRLGGTYGEHELRIQSEWDDIQIKHTAMNRDGFAAGAVRAAKWLVKNAEPGFYVLEDVIEEVIVQD